MARSAKFVPGMSCSPSAVTKQLTSQLQRLIGIRRQHSGNLSSRSLRLVETVNQQIEIIRQLAIKLGGGTREIEGENVHVTISETNEGLISAALRKASHKLSLIPGAISVGANGKVKQPNLKRFQRQRRQRRSIHDLCCADHLMNCECGHNSTEFDFLDDDQSAAFEAAAIYFNQPTCLDDHLIELYADNIAPQSQPVLASA